MSLSIEEIEAVRKDVEDLADRIEEMPPEHQNVCRPELRAVARAVLGKVGWRVTNPAGEVKEPRLWLLDARGNPIPPAVNEQGRPYQ